MARRLDPSAWDESDVRVRPSKRGTRPRTKERPKHEDAQVGMVTTVDRGRYAVVLPDRLDERITAMRARELRRTPIATGDRVAVVGAGGIGVDVSEWLTTGSSPTLPYASKKPCAPAARSSARRASASIPCTSGRSSSFTTSSAPSPSRPPRSARTRSSPARSSGVHRRT